MRLNNPNGYIDWLKTNPIFKNGELDNLPNFCIILHDSLIIEHLTLLGYNLRNYRIFKIGATDPIDFFVVKENNNNFEFILMNGLPGGGGISTQVAEMSSIGCSFFIHIGTCGLFDTEIKEGTIIVSNGSLKDQAGQLLSESINKISEPSISFKNDFIKYLRKIDKNYQIGTGVTIPIFYHQPVDFIKPLIISNEYDFVEMEQSPFFETCKLNKSKGISLVVGSDRYSIKNDEIDHKYYDLDQNVIKNELVELGINYFKTLKKTSANNGYK